ncbi:MAG: hypothetical protein KatS3mg121_0759 [Gammaproteobacteria bacterium]|nr:MAG: hypothetical protein KatS3mg121_0759 [Gammaproteobacteria bacterium]
MLEDEDFDAFDAQDDGDWSAGPLRALAEGEDLSKIVQDWVEAAADRRQSRLKVRQDVARLKAQAAYRRRLIELMADQKRLEQDLEDAFDFD